ncbi:hypothetical protein KY285_020763 [Solanum tuberosum]|uniref:Uncharacterized protein n=1 Tax=Solanum tuberosum TaxID=4113 RepID=M1DVA2_SOLTU|nr:hypothetical protein KY285_020763 [Solanum tuberosum]
MTEKRRAASEITKRGERSEWQEVCLAEILTLIHFSLEREAARRFVGGQREWRREAVLVCWWCGERKTMERILRWVRVRGVGHGSEKVCLPKLVMRQPRNADFVRLKKEERKMVRMCGGDRDGYARENIVSLARRVAATAF